MKKGDKFITMGDGAQVIQGDNRYVTLPPNKVFTYLREDDYGNIWVNVDGLDCRWAPGGNSRIIRQLPYPIETPATIEGYRELVSQIVKDMVTTFGVGVEIEANPFRTKFHLG